MKRLLTIILMLSFVGVTPAFAQDGPQVSAERLMADVSALSSDAMRGRVAAVNSIFIGGSNQLGEFESGVTAHWWGPRAATVVGGVGTILVSLAWFKLFPALANRDRMAPPPAAPLPPG